MDYIWSLDEKKSGDANTECQTQVIQDALQKVAGSCGYHGDSNNPDTLNPFTFP
jgi:hypothetical protein